MQTISNNNKTKDNMKYILNIILLSILFVPSAFASNPPVATTPGNTQCLSESGGKHIFWLKGGHQFIADGDCTIRETNLTPGGGSVVISCSMVDKTNTNRGFDLLLEGSGAILPPVVPEGSPKNPFEGSDTFVWHYYEDLAGTLTGWGGYEGVVIKVQNTGPLFQVGEGAGIHAPGIGAASWFLYEVVANDNHVYLPFDLSSKADINVAINDCPQKTFCDLEAGHVNTLSIYDFQRLLEEGKALPSKGQCKKVLVCFEGQTVSVPKFKLDDMPGFTNGVCPPVTTTTTLPPVTTTTTLPPVTTTTTLPPVTTTTTLPPVTTTTTLPPVTTTTTLPPVTTTTTLPPTCNKTCEVRNTIPLNTFFNGGDFNESFVTIVSKSGTVTGTLVVHGSLGQVVAEIPVSVEEGSSFQADIHTVLGQSEVGIAIFKSDNTAFYMSSSRHIFKDGRPMVVFSVAARATQHCSNTIVADWSTRGKVSVLELSNATNGQKTYTIKLFETHGELLETLTVTLGANSTRHIIFNDITEGTHGRVELEASQGVFATIMQYNWKELGIESACVKPLL